MEPEHEILVLEDYMRHGLYRTDPDLLAAHAAHPWITVWDDHELANNTWQTGAENHSEGEGFQKRIQAARRATSGCRSAPAEGDRGDLSPFQVGDLADLIMLDTRLVGRDEQLDYGKGIERAGSVEAFLKNDLYNPERKWVQNRKRGYRTHCKAAKPAVPLGRYWASRCSWASSISVIPPEEVAKLELSGVRPTAIEQAQQLAPYGLPSTSTPGTVTALPGSGCLPCSVPTPPTRSLWLAIPTMAGPLT